ncbi:unnamed protein product [Phytophthora fragariaefolia]|uniref:Unnamed protein product n=1 Tax=Phytophthora fragariaefolia TaxID=1490495 RepID=A0A9W6TTM3_9STRA|nr:unnamed protein product [Phytophthora fragariaefolia]
MRMKSLLPWYCNATSRHQSELTRPSLKLSAREQHGASTACSRVSTSAENANSQSPTDFAANEKMLADRSSNRSRHIVRTILSGQDLVPIPSSSTDTPDSSFKPTLENFDDAFDRERDMETMNLNIGKSIAFDAKRYFQHYGSPTSTSAANLFQLQERLTRTAPNWSDVREAYNRRRCNDEGTAKRKSGCSNPKLLRPASSRQARLSVHNSYNGSPTPSPVSSPSNASRAISTFLLAGTIALKPTTNT